MGDLKKPFISIIVPYRNARENIEECVQSLSNQDYPNDRYEIIMVDNYSTDGGAELSPECENLILLEEKRPGHGVARNKGISFAKGQIVMFTDSDCVPDSSWLETLSGAFSSENVVAVAGEIKAYRPTTDVEVFYEGLMSQRRNLSYEYPYAVTANVAFRKSLFKEIGSFDEGFSLTEDVDFCWRLQARGYKIKYEPEAVVYHKNIKTKLQLFKKIFLQGFYAPKVIKKNLKFLERAKKLSRINVQHYKELTKSLYRFFIAKKKNTNRLELSLNIIFLMAKKLGLLCGSIRFGFLHI